MKPQGTNRSWSKRSAAAPSMTSPPGVSASALPVEKARNRSPEKWEPVVPVRASPSVTRRASAEHWFGSSGASVATIAMTEPDTGSDLAGIRTKLA